MTKAIENTMFQIQKVQSLTSQFALHRKIATFFRNVCNNLDDNDEACQ